MKANELMIGDWVRGFVPDSNSTIYGIFNEQRVAIIAEPSKAYIELSIDDIQPIPLTPEILEKNGFNDISDHALKGYDTFRLDIEQRGFDYCITIKLKDYFKLQSYDDRWYTLCEMEFGCNNVHELQHALRLCGISLDIVV